MLGAPLRLRTIVTMANGQFLTKLTSMETRTRRFGATMAGVGTAAAAAIGVAAVGAGMAVKKYAEFEQAMKNMNSVAHASKSEFRALSNLAKEMGKTTRAGSTEAANAMYELASAGQRTAEIMNTLPGVIKLSTATQYGLSETTQAVVSTLNMFQLGAQSTNRIVNVFAATIGRTMAKMDKLANSFSVLGPLAKDAGLSIEDTSAALGILYNAGLDGSRAGTSLRRVLAGLLSPNEALIARLTAAGMTIDDIDPRFHSFGDVLRNLATAGVDVQSSFKEFSIRGASAILTLMQSADKLDELTADIFGTGEAAQMAAEQMDTLQGSLDQLNNKFEVAMQGWGKFFAPAIRGIADALGTLAEKADEANRHMDFLDEFDTGTGKLYDAYHMAAMMEQERGGGGGGGFTLPPKAPQYDEAIGPPLPLSMLRRIAALERYKKLQEDVRRLGGFMDYEAEVTEGYEGRQRTVGEQMRGGARVGIGRQAVLEGIGDRVKALGLSGAEGMSAMNAALRDGWASWQGYGDMVESVSSKLTASGDTIAELGRIAERQAQSLATSLSGIGQEMANVFQQHFLATKKFMQATLLAVGKGMVSLLEMYIDTGLQVVLAEKIKSLGILTMRGLFDPSNLAKIAPMLAAYAATKAALSGLRGAIKYHGGGIPWGMGAEAPIVIRPRREIVVDLPTAQRGGFGHSYLGALGMAGGPRIDVSVQIGRAELTSVQDADEIGERIGDRIAETFAVAEG